MQKQIPRLELPHTGQRLRPLGYADNATAMCTQVYIQSNFRGKTKKVQKTDFFKWNSGETLAPGALGLDAPTAVEIKQNPLPAPELRSKMSEKIASESDPCPSPEK
jgi:hypothetical protein